MDRSNNTRTDKSQGSDHGASSPKSIIQDTDFRIVPEDAPVGHCRMLIANRDLTE